MQTFEPLINLIVLLSLLSMAAERLANIVKLGDSGLRNGRGDRKERERQIAKYVMTVSVLLAVAVKADFFQIVSHMEAPWETLGWGAGPHAPGRIAGAIAGSALTGVSLGFGSKFWHDALDFVYAARRTS